MATVPTAPEAVPQADIATYLQAKKDAGQTITGRPYVISETGQSFTVVDVGGTLYAAGVEYTLPIVRTIGPLSADGVVAYFPLPPDKSILLTTMKILTNTTITLDGTHYWTFSQLITGASLGTDTPVSVDNSAGSAGEDLTLTITTFSTNPAPAGSYYASLTAAKTSTPGDVDVNVVLRGREVLATLT